MGAVVVGQNDHFDELLDVSGLVCPLPVLKAKASLARMPMGQTLKVIVTHHDSLREFTMLGKLPEFELVHQIDTSENYQYWIKRVAEADD